MKKETQKGFTLIELMIVVAIIGILASIAIPQFAQFRIKGFNAAAQADAKNGGTMMEAFYSDYYVYPDAIALTAAGPLSFTATGATAMPINLSSGVGAGLQKGSTTAADRCYHTKHVGGDKVMTITTQNPTVVPGATVAADISKDITAVTTLPTCTI